MSIKNKIILILAQVEVNKILENKKVSELSEGEKLVLAGYLMTMKNVYSEAK